MKRRLTKRQVEQAGVIDVINVLMSLTTVMLFAYALVEWLTRGD